MHQRSANISAKPASGPGMLGARDRVARHQVDARAHGGQQVADRRFLDRADIGEDRAILERRRDRRGDLGIGGERRRDHDEVGVLDRGGRVVGGLIGDVKTTHRRQRLGAAGASNDVCVWAVAAQHPREGRADEADADNGNPVEQRLRHQDAMNSASVAATFSFSSPVPTVMRMRSGRP